MNTKLSLTGKVFTTPAGEIKVLIENFTSAKKDELPNSYLSLEYASVVFTEDNALFFRGYDPTNMNKTYYITKGSIVYLNEWYSLQRIFKRAAKNLRRINKNLRSELNYYEKIINTIQTFSF